MESCPVCGNTDYMNQDGHYYCFECGTQSQEKRDEIVDDDEEITQFDFSQFQRLKGSKRKIEPVEELGEDDLVSVSYHEGWQVIYQTLLKKMTSLGFDPSLEESGKLLWFLYLKKVFKVQLETIGHVDSLNKRIKCRKLDQESRMDDEENRKTEHGFFLNRNAVSNRTLLVLLYLSCMMDNQFVPFHELLSLFHSGKLLKLSFDPALQKSKDMKIVLEQYYKDKTLAQYVIGHYRHIDMTRNILELSCNQFPVDIVSVGNDLLEKMLLPVSLRPLLKRLLILCHDVSLTNYVSFSKIHGTVSVSVMGVVIVLLKLIYRLDDKYEHVQSKLAESHDQLLIDKDTAVYSWRDWVAMVTLDNYRTLQSSTEPYCRDLPHLDDPSVFIDHCINVSMVTEWTPSQPSFMSYATSLSDCYSTYLKSKRTKEVKPTLDHINPVTEDIYCGQPRPLDTVTRPFTRSNRLLFIQFENEVVTIDTNHPVKPSWIPLQSIVESSGCGLEGSSGCGYLEGSSGQVDECSRITYYPLPLTFAQSPSEVIKDMGVSSLTEGGVSSSEQFLLNHAASNVLRVPVSVLVSQVMDVEKIMRRHSLLATVTRDVFNNSRTKTTVTV